MDKKKDLVGPSGVAEILQRMAPNRRERLLDSISTQDPSMADRIRGAMTTFESIMDLTDSSIQTVVSEVEQTLMVKALRGADKAVIAKVLGALSARRREVLGEEISLLPPLPKVEAENAQREVAQVMESLHIRGKIRSRISTDDVIE